MEVVVTPDLRTTSVGPGDTVMVYGFKGVVKCLKGDNGADQGANIDLGSLVGVELDKKVPQPTSGTLDKNDGMPENGTSDKDGTLDSDHTVFVPLRSIREYREDEAAATRIQANVRAFLGRLKFLKELSFLFWDHMENLQEFKTLDTKKNVSVPVVEYIKQKYSDQDGILKDPRIVRKRRFSDTTYEFTVKEYPPSNFSGPKLGNIVTLKFAHELLDMYKSGTCIELPIDYAQKILLDMLSWYSKNDKGAVQYVNVPPHENSNLVLVGDLHGQLNDLLWIFYKFGPPSSRNVYIFNGDIADRGMNASNIFLLLFAFKLAEPTSVIINRGNHESDDMNESYGFTKEVKKKYDGHIYNLFQRVFWELPLAVVIESRIIVVHGGLFRHDDVTLEKINGTNRKRDCPASPDLYDDSIMFDILWSDPQQNKGRDVSTRGVGCIRFGPDVTENFLKLNNLEICIRSHQVPSTLKGIDITHGGKCVTLFSASNYCQTTHNTGAILIFSQGLKFEAHEYMSPPLESIQMLANNTNNVTNKVIEAALVREMEAQDVTERLSRKFLDDVLLKLSELICEHKQRVWLYCYKHDKNKNGAISPEVWRNGLSELVGMTVPWIFAVKLFKVVDKTTGLVHYNDVLKSVYIGFEPVGYNHEHVKRECIAHMFDTMLQSDLSLKEILMIFDRNLDGLVSYSELDEAIRKLNIGLSNPQVKILMRTIFSSCLDGNQDGKADIVEFLSKLKVIYSASIKYNAKEEWMEKALPAIGRVILSNRVEAAARYYNPSKDDEVGKQEVNRRRSSAIRAFALFQKFQDYDKAGEGILSLDDFVRALKYMDLSKVEEELGLKLTDHHLAEIAHMVDVNNSNKINYLEFLQAFYVVDQSKYSVVNEMWDHICSTMYRHKNSLKQALYHYDVNHDGTVYIHEFKEVLYALNDVLGGTKAPLTFEQTEVLVECMDTNDEGMILYNDFLDSFKPMHKMASPPAIMH